MSKDEKQNKQGRGEPERWMDRSVSRHCRRAKEQRIQRSHCTDI